MIQELDCVTLLADLPDHDLNQGDLATVVMVYGQGEAFEVEFVTPDGLTKALVTLDGSLIEVAGIDAEDRRRGPVGTRGRFTTRGASSPT